MKRQLPTTACSECRSGKVPARTAGETLRLEREERDVTRVQLAVYMKLSESYVSDLEKGARVLSWELVDRYRKAIEKAVKERLEVSV